MDILWHDYALNKEDTIPITKAGLIEKASVVGRCGMMLLPVEPEHGVFEAP